MSFKLSTTFDGLTKVTMMSNTDVHKMQLFLIVKNIEYVIWDSALFIRPIDQDLLTDFNPTPTFNKFKSHTA